MSDPRLANFQKMAEADPDNELAHFSLGKLYFEQKSHAEAEASLRRTLELSPKHSLAHCLLGESLLAQGQTTVAIDTLTAGVLVAHEKGEFMPRNRMQELLREQGVEPPELPSTPAATESAATAGGFVCRRCNRANPALEEAPFRSELGQQIHAGICQPCWREWMEMSVKVINECRLNLMSSKDSEVYDQHMREFLGL